MSASEGHVVHDEFFQGLLSDFLDESGQLLDRLNENLLELDEFVATAAPADTLDPELMNEMFRAAHSLKGLSAMLGLREINSLTHKMENVFDAARRGGFAFTSEAVEVLFSAVDILVKMVDALCEESPANVDTASLIEQLDGLLHSGEAGGDASAVSSSSSAAADATTANTPNHGADQPDEASTPASGGATAPYGTSCKTSDDAASGDQQQGCSSAPLPSNTVSNTTGSSVQTSDDDIAAAEGAIEDVFADVVDEGDIPGKYRSIFIDEASVSLDEFTEILVSGDESPGPDATPKLLTIAHRIKGSAAAIGLNRVAKLSHVIEDVLQELGDRGEAPSPRLTDVLLKYSDTVRTYIEQLKTSIPESGHFSDLYRELVTAYREGGQDGDNSGSGNDSCGVNEGSGAAATGGSPSAGADYEEVVRLAPGGATCWFIRILFEPHLPAAGLKAQLVQEKANRLGAIFYSRPTSEQLDSLDEVTDLALGLTSDEPQEVIHENLNVSGVREIELQSLDDDEDALSTSANKSEESPAPKTSQSSEIPASANHETPAQSTGSETAAQKSPSKTTARKSGADTSPKRSAARTATNQTRRTADGDNSPKRVTETLRVDIDRLDQLMNLAGQLVISKARLSQIGEGLRTLIADKQSRQIVDHSFSLLDRLESNGDRAFGESATERELVATHARKLRADLEKIRETLNECIGARQHLNDFFEAVHQLERVSDGIQKTVMDTRMVPIGPLFTRFRRVIRDITRANGKEIDLVIGGEKTELDKRMIDELSDPLIHMVRNSADHGIETPEERIAAGKPRRGKVTLNAFHRGNHIVIQVLDDGRGIDPEKIARKAVERNMISMADAERLSRQKILQLIWEPGFSTAEKVTDISGRGMGMDIVKQKIEQLNGTVELDSELGHGTSFTIKLPLTLAILPSLMTEIDGEVFAVPIESVAEIVQVRREQLRTVHGQRTADVRGRIVSLVDLDEVFQWAVPPRCPKKEEPNELTLVVLGVEGRQLGLIVDAVLGEEDVVIKSLAENYRNVAGVAGASILGDGRVALILDTASVLEMSTRLENDRPEALQEVSA